MPNEPWTLYTATDHSAHRPVKAMDFLKIMHFARHSRAFCTLIDHFAEFLIHHIDRNIYTGYWQRWTEGRSRAGQDIYPRWLFRIRVSLNFAFYILTEQVNALVPSPWSCLANCICTCTHSRSIERNLIFTLWIKKWPARVRLLLLQLLLTPALLISPSRFFSSSTFHSHFSLFFSVFHLVTA